MKKLLTIGLIAMYILTLSIGNVQAQASATPASMYFDPGDGGTVYLDTNDKFTIDVKVNTGGENSSGVDSYVTFNSSEVQFVSGTYLSNFYPNNPIAMPSASTANSTKTILMAKTIQAPAPGDPFNYANGVGAFATLTFKALVGVGETVTFDFDFTLGSTTDSNVAGETKGEDILGQALSATLTIARTSTPVGDDPVITSIQPSSGDEGTNVIVRVYGRNFHTTEGTVHIGTWSSVVNSWTDSEIVIFVQGKNVEVDQNTQYPVKVTRGDDGKEAIYNGYTFVDVGLPLMIWLGFVPINGA